VVLPKIEVSNWLTGKNVSKNPTRSDDDVSALDVFDLSVLLSIICERSGLRYFEAINKWQGLFYHPSFNVW